MQTLNKSNMQTMISMYKHLEASGQGQIKTELNKAACNHSATIQGYLEK